MNMKTSPNDVSNTELLKEIQKLHVSDHEILEAMSAFATHVDSRMDKMDSRLDKADYRLDKMDSRMDRLATKEDLQNLQSEFSKLKATVVTKGYLDDKLADHHADLVKVMRKEDEKVMAMMKGK